MAFRSAIAREIQHFIAELIDYLDNSNQMPHHYNEAQTETMVTIAFNARTEVIDFNTVQRQKLIENLIFQLQMVSSGTYYLYHKEQIKKDSH